MPAEARGSVYPVRGGYGIRYRDKTGQIHRKSPSAPSAPPATGSR
jgi:hypothetical protein